MELKVIRKLEAQDKYCCKEGVLEIGIEDKPALGNIWCCAKCGHPVEPSAQHPVIVELCKDLVKNSTAVSIVAKEIIEPRVPCTICQHKSPLVNVGLSNGQHITMCPSCMAIHGHLDGVGNFGITLKAACSVLNCKPTELRTRLRPHLLAFSIINEE